MTARSGAVLVVDDDKMNRILLSKLLENEGYRPTSVVDGEEALEAVDKEHFDAVLLDVMMPGIDGIEVLRSLKSDSRWWHIPVIMISALDDTPSIARCLEIGAEDYLLRPFDPVLLRSRINACLARKRFHDLEEEYHAIVREQRNELGELKAALEDRLADGVAEDVRPAPPSAEVVVVTVALSGVKELHAALASVLDEFGATVVFAGTDTLTVVFDDPVPHPDPAARAREFAASAGAILDEAQRQVRDGP